MVQPFDYSIRSTAQGPLQALSQGMQLGQQFAQIAEQREAQRLRQQMEQEKLRQAQEAAAAEQAARGVYFSDPNPTNALRWQATLTADMAKALNPGIEALSRDQLTTLNTNGLRDYALLTSGRSDMVMSDLQAQARARREANDEPGARRLEDVAEVVRVSPQAVASTLLAQVASRPGGADLITKFNEARKGAPELTIKELEAKFKPEMLASELQLTQSQIEQAKAARAASEAAAKKSGEEAAAAKARAEQMAAGVIEPEKRPELEAKLRGEYNNQTKNFGEVKAAYGRVLASEETAAGDLALIFSYMKMLDPGSVVREGEFATAEQAAGIPDRIRNIYNKLLTGERLNPDQRKMFASQAKSLYDQSRQQEALVRSGVERIARGYGLNVGNIFYEAAETTPTAPARSPSAPTPAPAPAPAPARGATAPAPTAAPSPISTPQAAPQAAPPVVRQAAAPSFAPLPPAPPSPPPAPLPGGRTQVGSVPSPVPAQREAPPNVGVVMPERGTTRFQVTAPNGATYYFPTRAAAEEFKRRGGF